MPQNVKQSHSDIKKIYTGCGIKTDSKNTINATPKNTPCKLLLKVNSCYYKFLRYSKIHCQYLFY